MPHDVELQFAARTDTGQVRSHNEDAITYSAEHGFAILADGMGGYSAGEVASGIATLEIEESLETALQTTRGGWTKDSGQLLRDAILHANISIIEAARREPRYSGMGTTIVATLFHHDKLTVAHIGDSRAYRFRAGRLEAITRDHSVLQEQIDAGLISVEDARFAQNRNLLTRAMGIEDDVEVEVHEHVTQAGDLYLLCSDGLFDMVPDEEIAIILADGARDLDAACDALVAEANRMGGRDNISVVLVLVRSTSPEAGEGMLGRVLGWIK
ncbi:MAG: Stp1/IreP family PP2C-type Ser/Thr phosphatase [Noviherbaspirillum sp.]